MNRKSNPYLALIALLLMAVILVCCGAGGSSEPKPAEPTEYLTCTDTTTATTATTTTAPAPVVEYELTDGERDLVERVVMAEASGEPFNGQVAVAQCILNACRLDDIRPAEAVKKYQYAKARPDPTDEVKAAVALVFDDGCTVFGDDVLFFYAPARTTSEWHESPTLVCTIGGHKFFKEAEQ